jgi:peptidoglycan/xylan/chitin deacetylase (PgdA/CDA1 family)
MRKIIPLLLAAMLIIAGGCVPDREPAAPTPTVLPPTATSTTTPAPSFTPTPTFTPTVTPTPTWAFQPAGKIVCPILLYHRIAEPPNPASNDARYYVPPADFEMQMQTLHDWGYTAIPLSLLITAITDGATLPPRPFVLTFDDGDISVYTAAFPVMQRYGYTGTIYLVAERLHVDGFMGPTEVKTLTDAGWEVGSHSMTHVDLRVDPERLRAEGYESRLKLQDELGVPVDTFAYPFGAMDAFTVDHIDAYGYRAAVGLGTFYGHDRGTLFYLSRIEVRNGTGPAKLAAILPWAGPFEATVTPTPVPTSTP